MAFFDDLGKKLSQAGQTAVQKTKEVTDIARTNAAIGEQEKRIAEIYSEIGKLYVMKYPSGGDEEFQVLLERLRDAENKIIEFRKQIQEIKGVVRCEKCGAEVAGNSAFCNSCGAKMTVTPISVADIDSVICPSCGASVDKSSRFCTSCGKILAEVNAERIVSQNDNADPNPVNNAESESGTTESTGVSDCGNT